VKKIANISHEWGDTKLMRDAKSHKSMVTARASGELVAHVLNELGAFDQHDRVMRMSINAHVGSEGLRLELTYEDGADGEA